MTTNIDLLLPIDVLAREIDVRLLLAGHYAGRGRRVFIGQHDVIYGLMLQMRGGIYLGKHAFRRFSHQEGNEVLYLEMKARDLTMIYLGEEAGIFSGHEEARWRRALLEQVDPRVFDSSDYLCTWGEFQRGVYTDEAPSLAPNVRVTGHPRFDLYKPAHRGYFAEDVARLREQHGDFVLFNMSFAGANPILGIEDFFSPRQGYELEFPERRARWLGTWGSETRKLTHAVSLCARFADEFPDRTLVVRPHPSEDLTLYRSAFRHTPQIVIRSDGPVSPWLLAASAVIHCGCTTAIEAFLADLPVISFHPEPDDGHEPLLPGLFGIPAATEDEAIQALRDGARQQRDDERDELGGRFIANLHTDSVAELLGVVEEAGSAQARVTQRKPADLAVYAREAERRAVAQAKAIVRPLFPSRQARYVGFKNYFPGMRSDEIRRKVRAVEGLTGKALRVRQYSPQLLVIEGD